MSFRSFQTRVVVAFLALITLVQAGTLIAVNTAITRSARSHVKEELTTAARVFTQVIDARNRRLTEAARILSEDFGFKQVLALSDRARMWCGSPARPTEAARFLQPARFTIPRFRAHAAGSRSRPGSQARFMRCGSMAAMPIGRSPKRRRIQACPTRGSRRRTSITAS